MSATEQSPVNRPLVGVKYQNKKLQQAESLAQKPEVWNRETRTKYTEDVGKSLTIYKEICLNPNFPTDDKINAIISFIKYIPDEGLDMLQRWKDMLAFVRNKEAENLVAVLVRLTRAPEINSHERLNIAVTLYNKCYLTVCYLCFADLANDNSVLVDYRVEACRYLFASETPDHRELAQECLIGIIETNGYPCEYRYKTIAGFISKTGIATRLNATKLKVAYDETFVYGLQNAFFFNEENGVRERILSGQHMLDMGCVPQETKKEILDILVRISETHADTMVRADAADVILRLGTPEYKTRARQIITDLGFDSVTSLSTSLLTGNALSRVRTIYNNSQNVHDEKIAESVNKFIERIIADTDVQLKSYLEVYQEVADMIRERGLAPTKRFMAFKAMNRVHIDTATFTDNKVTLAEIFVHVWLRICAADNEKRKQLEDALLDELVDMGDTCSSGHSARFVNVFAAEDEDFRIGWEEQIVANIAGRINAKIRDHPDADLRASISMGMLPDAEEEDRKAYVTFINDALDAIRKEMYKEFVTEGYIRSKEFDAYFSKGKTQWLKLGAPK